ncbi:MAG: hypothetical protein EXS02_14410 [Planctomycetes bacterium]|nr:hypothetical protein [Planctomycetota bacterium]
MTRSIAWLLMLLPIALKAQSAPPIPAKAQQPVTKLAKWPTLTPPEQERVTALTGQFRKADLALQKTAADQIAAIGDGAIPILQQKISDRDEAINKQVFALLDRMLGPQHASLMANDSKSPKLALRSYLLLRMCRLVDPDLKPVLLVATKDKDEDNAYVAQVGLLGLGEVSALLPVIDGCRTNWVEIRALVAAVLPAARSELLGRATAERIGNEKPPGQAAALRVFRYLGKKEQAPLIRHHLQAEDNIVKKEAINAMRAINGLEPIENLSVFDAIKMAKEWSTK